MMTSDMTLLTAIREMLPLDSRYYLYAVSAHGPSGSAPDCSAISGRHAECLTTLPDTIHASAIKVGSEYKIFTRLGGPAGVWHGIVGFRSSDCKAYPSRLLQWASDKHMTVSVSGPAHEHHI